MTEYSDLGAAMLRMYSQMGRAFGNAAANLQLYHIQQRTQTKEISMKMLPRHEALRMTEEALGTVSPDTEIVSLGVTPSGVSFSFQQRDDDGEAVGPLLSRVVEREIPEPEHHVAVCYIGDSRRYNVIVRGGEPIKVGQYLEVRSWRSGRYQFARVIELDPPPGDGTLGGAVAGKQAVRRVKIQPQDEA